MTVEHIYIVICRQYLFFGDCKRSLVSKIAFRVSLMHMLLYCGHKTMHLFINHARESYIKKANLNYVRIFTLAAEVKAWYLVATCIMLFDNLGSVLRWATASPRPRTCSRVDFFLTTSSSNSCISKQSIISENYLLYLKTFKI